MSGINKKYRLPNGKRYFFYLLVIQDGLSVFRRSHLRGHRRRNRRSGLRQSCSSPLDRVESE